MDEKTDIPLPISHKDQHDRQTARRAHFQRVLRAVILTIGTLYVLSYAVPLFAPEWLQRVDIVWNGKCGHHRPEVALKTVSGAPIPHIGLGTWNSKPKDVTDAVYTALSEGYTHLDCASGYKNEKEVGKGISKAIKDGKVKREDIWVTSKLWNDRHSADLVFPAVTKTLSDLGLKYLDLYLMHWPVSFPESSTSSSDPFIEYVSTYLAMEGLVRLGLVRYIGVCNFSPAQLQKLMAYTTIRPAVHQMEMHPYLQQVPWLKAHQDMGIVVTAYSPLGNTNPTYHDDNSTIPLLLEHPNVLSVAASSGCTPAQVVLKWGQSRGTVVIPKSVHADRIKENLESKDCDLSEQDAAIISGIADDVVQRFNNPAKNWGVDLFDGLD